MPLSEYQKDFIEQDVVTLKNSIAKADSVTIVTESTRPIKMKETKLTLMLENILQTSVMLCYLCGMNLNPRVVVVLPK